ncbi:MULTISPECIES: cytochrome c oxidase assembly factor CtaG [unclassified Paenibacillus]|uniref:cytochrome c oxidase assembly factor CtaG n=1 Tax=unclassified Paenibacillus TaxID=185978 RepID=UPI0024057F2E|nr:MULTISPECIES: cytochrome c oxidase assembly factor CtaG [unclassified Paenibacillus]MDF9843393.1 putative membrane protein [Paenibacillus sp. PastF-2]MDF9849981.1 putative membrane protein [Paenibacillus sp. PastM-2]MDF9856689.1 putative membrane protein [Paenibacillus sp. PastF-1]MDH6481959.1 putative membrane protein [Paenibacillus sp. PastH-2]MDH6509384.1 putative membrane protein [Paenibacillus sp. PastM-3]
MLGLQYFSFADLWSPLLLAATLLLAAGYLVLIGPLAQRFPGSAEVPLRQRALFLGGLLVLYLAQGGPVSLLGHILFSFHMVSMALSYLIAVPLMMLGIPEWCWRALMRVNPLRRLSFLAHPVVAALLFNGLFSLYHIPVIHDYVMLHFTVHRLYYAVLFLTSALMWWTLINPLPEHRRAGGPVKIGFIFLNMVLLTPACGLIIFASSPLYATYSDPAVWARAMGYCVSGDPAALLQAFGGPGFFGGLSPKVDQQVGGIVMKFIQEFIFASMLAYVFYHWYKKENGQDDPDLSGPSGELGDGALTRV